MSVKGEKRDIVLYNVNVARETSEEIKKIITKKEEETGIRMNKTQVIEYLIKKGIKAENEK